MKLWRPNVRSALPALSVVAVVAAAAVVWQNLPTPVDIYGPFDVHAEIGAPAMGRAVTATVTAVRIAPQANSVKAAGQWVVIDATVEATRTSDVPHTELIVGPNTYTASDRFFASTLGAQLDPEIAQRGAWVFDVAPALLTPGTTESLWLHLWVGDARLDSRLVIRIPVDDSRVSKTNAVTLAPSVQAGS